MRQDGSGPPYIKAGIGRRSRVIYDVADILAWIESHRLAPKSAEPQPETILEADELPT